MNVLSIGQILGKLALAILSLYLIPGKVQAQTATLLPNRIEAESYTANGGQVDPKTVGNARVIGTMAAGEWLEYQVVVPETGYYKVNTRVANGLTDSAEISIGSTSNTITKIIIGSGHGWDTETGFRIEEVGQLYLVEGQQTIRVSVLEPWFDLDWLAFEYGDYVGCWIADTTGDGKVSIDDYLGLSSTFLTENPDYDFDNSGTVDLEDYLLLSKHFLSECVTVALPEVSPLPSPTPELGDVNTLKDAFAATGRYAGATINDTPWRESISLGENNKFTVVNNQYLNKAREQYSLVGMENRAKFRAIVPESAFSQRYSTDYRQVDAFVEWARQNNLKIHLHASVWFNNIPKWMENRYGDGNSLSSNDKQEIEDWLEWFIKDYIGRYKNSGVIRSWDILNEIVQWRSQSEGGTQIRKDLYFKALGQGQGRYTQGMTQRERELADAYVYTEKIFRWAREADPQRTIKLYANDYNLRHDTGKAEYYYDLLRLWKQNNVPVDGIGFQYHHQIETTFESSDPNKISTYEQNVSAFQKMVNIKPDIELLITELDVGIRTPITSSNRTVKYQTQARVYADSVRACMQFPQCKGVITWGISDQYSWIPSHTNNEFDDGLPFDRNYNPKPAFEAILREALQAAR